MKTVAFLCFISVFSFPLTNLEPADIDPEDPTCTVFLKASSERGAAPSKENLDTLVLLTNIKKSDPFWKVVEFVQKQGVKETVTFNGGKLEPAFKKLARIKPGYVVVVLKPDTLDVNFHFDLLEQASRLDKEPFVDFAFGYITGANAEEALAFAKGIVDAKKKKISKHILEFGPSSRPGPTSGKNAHGWAKGFKIQKLNHENDAKDIPAKIKKIKGFGILSAWGHGMPDGVAHGLKGKDLRESGLDLFPTLYFSGPCYCGVPSGWYKWENGGMKKAVTPPDESFLLALIKARSVGIFAGLDPDRGETNSHEREYVLYTGDPLGCAAKSTYDDAVVAYRKPEFELPHYEIGRGKPHKGIADTMISGGACRALCGDPTFQPFKKAGEEPFVVKTKWLKKGLKVTWEGTSKVKGYWSCVDVYRAKGTWTHRISFRFTIPIDKAMKIRDFKTISITKDGKDLPYEYPTAAIELWGGEARIHGMIIFPKDMPEKALWNGNKFKAEFMFSTSR